MQAVAGLKSRPQHRASVCKPLTNLHFGPRIDDMKP